MQEKKVRGSYAKKPIEQRGKTHRESAIYNGFWKEHTMDQVMAFTDEELDDAISRFIDKYAASQRKRNPSWWYPEKSIIMAFKPKKPSKYKADNFNKRIKKGFDSNGTYFV